MSLLSTILSQITLEPATFFNAVVRNIDEGAQVTSNLIIGRFSKAWKTTLKYRFKNYVWA